ncbi:hypothetical protein, partial [Cetobacterium sp.]
MANQQIDNIEDINEAINPITPPIDGQEGLEMLGHNRNQPVVLSRFSRSFFKIYSHLISLHSSVKNLGQNKLDKGGYDGTALELKNWLVANYTTLMNNIRDTLTNMINLKLPHGGYNGSGQQLKNEIDTKVSKSGDTMTGLLQMNAPIQSAGYMSDHGAIANLGGGSFRFGTAGLNWRIGVKGSDGHLGVWTQQDDTILFQPYNFSPEGRLTAQGGLILPQSNQASINVKGICGGYNQAVGFNCG